MGGVHCMYSINLGDLAGPTRPPLEDVNYALGNHRPKSSPRTVLTRKIPPCTNKNKPVARATASGRYWLGGPDKSLKLPRYNGPTQTDPALSKLEEYRQTLGGFVRRCTMRTPGILAAIASAIVLGAAAKLPFDHAVRDAAPVARRTPRSIPGAYVTHERHRPGHTEGWARRELADAQAILPMRVGLTQSNLDRGHDLLMDM